MTLDPNARVVVVSAIEQKGVLKAAFNLGAADFVVKPFDRNLLIKTLEQLVATETPAGEPEPMATEAV